MKLNRLHKKYFFSAIQPLILGIVILASLFFMPFVTNNKIYAEFGEGAGCTAAGHAGVCWDRVSHGCGTYYDSGNYCPGDNSVQCCVNSNVACSAGANGACHNSSSGGFGNTYGCSGSWYSGYCPGPSDVQCCVPMPPPTNVNASCSGNSVTVTWSVPPGYSYSYARIYDLTSSTQYYPGPMTGSSYSIASTPSHQYSYWVHTTNSAGSPYSVEVPTAWTATVTCPAAPTATPTPTITPTPTVPPCQVDGSTPAGTVLSTGVATTVSAVRDNNTALYGGQNAVDGLLNQNAYWSAGAGAPQWIELDLGSIQPVSGMKLYNKQSPDGTSNIQILGGTSPNPTTNLRTINCNTTDGQIMNVIFSTPKNVRYIRVNTSQSASWVAWSEITVYGSAPGVQSHTPGIVFSGAGTTDFGQGNVSTTGWLVGGATYAEEYPTESRQSEVSYEYLLDKITSASIPITDITTVSGCSNLASCTLPPGLQNGVYKANGNLTLNPMTFLPDKNFVFLINGDLTILGSIIVPNGSSAFFASSNDINIDKNVGTFTNLFPLPGGQLQGIYSADRDFNIEGVNDCVVGKDKMLNFE